MENTQKLMKNKNKLCDKSTAKNDSSLNYVIINFIQVLFIYYLHYIQKANHAHRSA